MYRTISANTRKGEIFHIIYLIYRNVDCVYKKEKHT